MFSGILNIESTDVSDYSDSTFCIEYILLSIYKSPHTHTHTHIYTFIFKHVLLKTKEHCLLF